MVTVAIYRGATLIRTIWSARSLTASTWTWTWDGKDAAGAFVAPGAYRVSVTATGWVGATRLTRPITVETH